MVARVNLMTVSCKYLFLFAELYRVSQHLADLRFVDIKVGSSGYQTGQQGSYTVTAENVTNVSTKDSLQGAGTPCRIVSTIVVRRMKGNQWPR